MTRKILRLPFFRGALLLLAISAEGAALAQECALPQKRVSETQLMFGRNIGGQLGVSDKSWAQFVEREIAPRFPDGFTTLDALGRWRDSATKRLIREPSKIVIIVAPEDPKRQEAIDAIVAAYKSRFRQQAVGVLTRPACASF